MHGCDIFTTDDTLSNDPMEVQIYYNNGWRIRFYLSKNSGCESIEGTILRDPNHKRLTFYSTNPTGYGYIDGIFRSILHNNIHIIIYCTLLYYCT